MISSDSSGAAVCTGLFDFGQLISQHPCDTAKANSYAAYICGNGRDLTGSLFDYIYCISAAYYFLLLCAIPAATWYHWSSAVTAINWPNCLFKTILPAGKAGKLNLWTICDMDMQDWDLYVDTVKYKHTVFV